MIDMDTEEVSNDDRAIGLYKIHYIFTNFEGF
jgi:hypothetical protein